MGSTTPFSHLPWACRRAVFPAPSEEKDSPSTSSGQMEEEDNVQYNSNSAISSRQPASSGTASASRSPGFAPASSTHSRSSGEPLITSIASTSSVYSYLKSVPRQIG